MFEVTSSFLFPDYKANAESNSWRHIVIRINN